MFKPEDERVDPRSGHSWWTRKKRRGSEVFIAAKSPLNQVQFSLKKNLQAELSGDEFAAAGLQNNLRDRRNRSMCGPSRSGVSMPVVLAAGGATAKVAPSENPSPDQQRLAPSGHQKKSDFGSQ